MPRRFPKTVQQVQHGQDGVMQEHARAGMAHHAADLLAPAGTVAMHGAPGAGGLAPAKGAALKPFEGIRREASAIAAQTFYLGIVVGFTLEGDHGVKGACFALQAFRRLHCFFPPASGSGSRCSQ